MENKTSTNGLWLLPEDHKRLQMFKGFSSEPAAMRADEFYAVSPTFKHVVGPISATGCMSYQQEIKPFHGHASTGFIECPEGKPAFIHYALISRAPVMCFNENIFEVVIYTYENDHGVCPSPLPDDRTNPAHITRLTFTVANDTIIYFKEWIEHQFNTRESPFYQYVSAITLHLQSANVLATKRALGKDLNKFRKVMQEVPNLGCVDVEYKVLHYLPIYHV